MKTYWIRTREGHVQERQADSFQTEDGSLILVVDGRAIAQFVAGEWLRIMEAPPTSPTDEIRRIVREELDVAQAVKRQKGGRR